ncbi:MAG: hypothetical protein KC505_09445 [Myxococcales bacterium]|nr:hypothetical protein [Myxococcales bacterium]USN51784.1 MAG: hypothetical protein H6731_05095 [Myxococcales bacterium]
MAKRLEHSLFETTQITQRKNRQPPLLSCIFSTFFLLCMPTWTMGVESTSSLMEIDEAKTISQKSFQKFIEKIAQKQKNAANFVRINMSYLIGQKISELTFIVILKTALYANGFYISKKLDRDINLHASLAFENNL